MSDSTDAHCRDLLPWYAADLLDAAARATVARHLATCAACQRELAQWSELGALASDALEEITPATTTATSWQRLQASFSPELLPNGKHTLIRGVTYMEFEQQTSPTMAAPKRHLARRPFLMLVAVVFVAILSIASFVVFTSHTQRGHGGVALRPPTSTQAPIVYPAGVSLVTPNPSAHTPINPPITSTGVSIADGKLLVIGQTATFHAGDTIYVSFAVHGASANDVLSMKWYINGADLTPFLIQSHADCCTKVMADSKDTDVIFSLASPIQVASPGAGKAEIFYNTTLAYTVVFTILTPTTSTPSR